MHSRSLGLQKKLPPMFSCVVNGVPVPDRDEIRQNRTSIAHGLAGVPDELTQGRLHHRRCFQVVKKSIPEGMLPKTLILRRTQDLGEKLNGRRPGYRAHRIQQLSLFIYRLRLLVHLDQYAIDIWDFLSCTAPLGIGIIVKMALMDEAEEDRVRMLQPPFDLPPMAHPDEPMCAHSPGNYQEAPNDDSGLHLPAHGVYLKSGHTTRFFD